MTKLDELLSLVAKANKLIKRAEQLKVKQQELLISFK